MYQANMLGAIKRPKGRLLRILGVFVFLLGTIVCYGAPLFQESLPAFPRTMLVAPWVYGPLAGLCLAITGWALRAAFDPNADAHTRLKRPRSPWDGPFTLEEFEKLMGETVVEGVRP